MAQHVDYDTDKRIIYVTTAPVNGEVSIDVQIDLYSDMKEDWKDDTTLNRFALPISSVGGQPLPGSKTLGDTYFLAPDWKIRPYEADHKLAINGNLFSEDGTSVVIPPIGNYQVLVEMFVSNLSDSSIAQLSQIEYSLFNGGVSYDSVNGHAGTGYTSGGDPIGTPPAPSNNLTDTRTILDIRGLSTVYVEGDLTITDVANWDDVTWIGDSLLDTTIHIEAAASTIKGQFFNCTISGEVDGLNKVQGCIVNGLTGIDGYMNECPLVSATLGTGQIVNIWDCKSTVPGVTTPTIDMNATAQVIMHEYSGGVKFINYSGSDSHTIQVEGQAILDSATITGGTWVFRGACNVRDENGAYIPSGTWNGGVTIINDTTQARLEEQLTFTDLLAAKKVNI